MKAAETSPHEYAANHIHARDGLKPFFACDSVVKDAGGSRDSGFEIDGERWTTTLYYQDSGIVNPGETTSAGTPFALEEMREFRLSVERSEVEDLAGQQSFNIHLAPRWQNMEVENAQGQVSDFTVPDAIGEGVNLKVRGSNIEFDRYPELIQEAFESVGIARSYFESFHDLSNIEDAARYVRLDKTRSGPIHSRSGPIASMAHLLEHDRQGCRKLHQNDDDNDGKNLPGFYHTVTLGPTRIREAFPSHKLPKEIKHYYAKEARNKNKSDPLAHPKLEAAYQASQWDDTLDLGPESIKQLNEELEETILSVLKDAGIQIHSSHEGPFIPDAYFDAENVEHESDPTVSLDLTQLRTTQDSVVIKHIKDGLSPVEWESLSTLVTDGGKISPNDIADEHDRHPDSVRRALGRIDDLVEREYDRVSLRSSHVAELVHDAVEQAESAVRNAAEMSGKALEAAERRVDEGMSALVAWASRNDLDLDQTDEVAINLGKVEGKTMREVKNEIRRVLREGRQIWVEAGQDPTDYSAGEWSARAEVEKFPRAESLTATTRKTIGGWIQEYVID